jgi:NADP-dependent 3-hydroxy acid dehydrogenase YdfG
MEKQDIQALFDVNGKVALITGATGGFGQAAARGLAAAGAKVMATARTASALEKLVKEIREGGGQAGFSAGDPVNLEE